MPKNKILIVENESIVAKQIEIWLTNLDYIVPAITTTGREAIQTITESPPDLILMDIKLTDDMDGITTAERIRENYSIPIIYLTAYSDDKTLQRAKPTEPAGYLTKPFAPKELHTTIQTALYNHQMDKKLRESEERYRSLFDGIPIGLYRTTPEGEIVDANMAMVEMLGYRDRESLLAANVADTLVDPQARQQWQDRLNNENIVRGFETQIRRNDGTLIWVEDNAQAILDKHGQIRYYEGSIKDITERKKTEDALLESTQASVDIVHAVPAGLFIYQYEPPDRLILLDGNSTAEQFTQLNVDEWRGREFNEIWPQAQETGIAQIYLDVMKTGEAFETENLEYEDERIKGAFKIRAFPMPANRLGVAFENITEQKQAEQVSEDNIQELKIAYRQAIIYAQELTGEITERRRAEQEIRDLNEELEQRVSDRTRDLSVLYLITMVTSNFLDLDAMLARSLDQLLATIKRNIGTIHLVEDTQDTLHLATQYGVPDHVVDEIENIPLTNELVAWIINNKEALLIPDVTKDARINKIVSHFSISYTFLSLPMRAAGQVLGILTILGGEAQQFNAEEVALLASVADQVGVAVENARLRQQAEHAAIIEERERLARELHDSVTQSLYSLALFAEAGESLIDSNDLEEAKHNLRRMGETAQQALKEMRLLVYQLRPFDLEKEGLIGALHQRLSAVEGRVNIKARLVADELVDLPAPLEEELYRIAQEALNNALKHAAATSVTIYLRIKDNEVELEVVDDGKGFDPLAAANTGGMGLQSMQARAEKLGGTFSITSGTDEGSSVKVNIEINQLL